MRPSGAACRPSARSHSLGNLDESIAIAAETIGSGIPFQLGFQRRFDAGYREAHDRIHDGSLGILYAVRPGHDPAPPHEAYIAQSGGLFRDFSVHDFDVLRFMTGCEVEEVYAAGGVRGFPVSPSTTTSTRPCWRSASLMVRSPR